MCGDDARFEKHLPLTRKIQKKAKWFYWVLWLNIREFLYSYGGWIPLALSVSSLRQRRIFV
jgi:hypothetical protein